MVVIAADRLERLCLAAFKAAGCPTSEAELASKFLVLANLRGHDSHGVQRVPAYIQSIKSGTIKPGAQISIVKESPSTALVDGNWGLGQATAKRCMELAIEKASKHGVGIVSVFNCNHIGRLADYAEMAIKKDMLGFLTVNVGLSGPGRPISDRGTVAPYGGGKGVLGTNPLCYGIPAGREQPIIFDMATSIWPIGKVQVARARGTRVPDGVMLDGSGKPTNNAADFFGTPRGALLPFGVMVAYKGYVLALVVDILSGALSGFGTGLRAHTNGTFMMALNISYFQPIEEFKAEVDRLIKDCNGIPIYEGFVGIHGEKEVLVPGDPERMLEEKYRKEGVYVDEPTWDQLVSTAKSFGIDPDKV